MHTCRSARRIVLAVTLAVLIPRAGSAQQGTGSEGTRTRIDLIPFAGYAHGGASSHDAWIGGLRVGLRTETWGVAYTQESWIAGWPCPRETEDVCDDPVSSTLGVERRFAQPDGVALVAGADAGVMSWYGARAMGVVRVGVEQPVPPLGAIRIEGQAQKTFGIGVATVAALVGFRFSFGGPRLPHR